MRILMVGLDAAGKTTILYKLKLGEGKRNNTCVLLGLFLSWTLLTQSWRLFSLVDPFLLLSCLFLGHSRNYYPDDWL